MKGRLQDYESTSPGRKKKLSVGGEFMEGMKIGYESASPPPASP
jgi:hypothetical protein